MRRLISHIEPSGGWQFRILYVVSMEPDSMSYEFQTYCVNVHSNTMLLAVVRMLQVHGHPAKT